MKLEKYGRPVDKITEKIHPIEKGHEFCFRRLDSLLDYVLLRHPEIYFDYVDALENRARSLLKREYFESSSERIEELASEYPTIRNQPSLAMTQLGFFLQILDISENEFWTNDLMEIDNSNFHQSAVIPEYNWLDVLIEILGREEAIATYKVAAERYCVKYDGPTITRFESLDELREAYLRFWEGGRLGRIRLASNVENGVFVKRCENCEKVDGLGDLEKYDREILKSVMCHADFQVFRLHNDSFVLTRSKTIAAGDPYCDFVYHDIRFDKKLEHPSV
ncbi:MAG: L-2-amino-thiazoline-4-carboxylic acid hydrolase [Candidatus Thorarchaeota archaeon]|nr:MAG: L-2-amino-thiazoline-4-carboxylic acid hydrolase [Candidatus Thorarchaeota archaeon]